VIKLLKLRVRRSTDLATAEPKAGRLRGIFGELMRDTRASVVIFMAVAMVALATATGVGVDYARGENFKIALQAAVDSAAISAASIYVNAGYATQATTVANNYLTQAIPHLPSNNGVTTSVVLSAAPPFTVTVNANGSINSGFGGLIRPTIPVSVTAVANGPTNPNIDFYLMLDSSPSMAIAATTAGITTMVNNTQGECDSPPNGGSTCGCAFACHEQSPGSESHYIPTGTGSPLCTASNNYKYCSASGTGNPSGEDNYALAQALGVTLRIDNVRTATQNLMTTAQTTMAAESSVYRVAIYSFDYAVHTIQTLTSSLTTAQTSAGNIALLEVYSNGCLTSSCPSGTAGDDDTDTDFSNAMSNLNTTMPNPGFGTNNAGDTPQEVLFVVTDGLEDKIVSTCSPNANCVSAGGGMLRQQYLVDTTWCDTVKNRGIRIAMLYTVYYPLPTNGWYNTYVSPIQSQIGPTLQACASPGLFFQVDTGGDISAAMKALFLSAVQSAYLAK
jgi:hypothetical protein